MSDDTEKTVPVHPFDLDHCLREEVFGKINQLVDLHSLLRDID